MAGSAGDGGVRAASGLRGGATGSRAVETYLRNFESERARYQEILEITLCYGVKCLAQTFSLKGITCAELRTLTGYREVRNRDFYVRNAGRARPSPAAASPPSDVVVQRTQAEVRTKPSHSWRDGEVEMADFPESSGAVDSQSCRGEAPEATTTRPSDALYTLPPAFDEIDFHTQLLGKPLVDLAWKTFAGRKGSQLATKQELDERFRRIDQRKNVAAIPKPELPVSSFTGFLGGYVTECVRQSQRVGGSLDGDGELEEDGDSNKESREMEPGRRSRGTAPTCSRPRVSRTSDTGVKRLGMATARPRNPVRRQQPPQRQPQATTPRSLQHVRSAIQPELETQRQKVLRVKKTQSQRMAESLARARLAEYDAKRELQDARDRRGAPKKMPLSKITPGAAALEIVDDFMKSPLMDTFGRDDTAGAERPIGRSDRKPRAQRDPLKEELYGTAALDDSFLGCKPASDPARRQEQRPERSKRNYNGWLGDFGPLHTKTVRPEWGETEEDSAGDGGKQHSTAANFEWSFDYLEGEASARAPRRASHKSKPNKSFSSENGDVTGDVLADDLSDDLSATSDPVFRWLKDAV